jgi:hypothetical protein
MKTLFDGGGGVAGRKGDYAVNVNRIMPTVLRFARGVHQYDRAQFRRLLTRLRCVMRYDLGSQAIGRSQKRQFWLTAREPRHPQMRRFVGEWPLSCRRWR